MQTIPTNSTTTENTDMRDLSEIRELMKTKGVQVTRPRNRTEGGPIRFVYIDGQPSGFITDEQPAAERWSQMHPNTRAAYIAAGYTEPAAPFATQHACDCGKRIRVTWSKEHSAHGIAHVCDKCATLEPLPEPATEQAFETILSNIRALPGLDEEADTFRAVSEILWEILISGQKTAALRKLQEIAAKAAAAANGGVCEACGEECQELMHGPDGTEVCPACFNAGGH